jgi:uncharacterized membrane protein
MLRSVLNLATMVTFYYALRALPLADTLAIAYAAPLFMCLLSIVLLGEKVGPRRWTAIVVGFVGVLIIVQPGGTGLRPAALLALTSALLYALTNITSRQLSTSEQSHTILFYYSVSCLVVMGPIMSWNWTTPSWQDWLVFLVVGVAGSFGQFCLNQALRYGEVPLLAPIDYTSRSGAWRSAMWSSTSCRPGRCSAGPRSSSPAASTSSSAKPSWPGPVAARHGPARLPGRRHRRSCHRPETSGARESRIVKTSPCTGDFLGLDPYVVSVLDCINVGWGRGCAAAPFRFRAVGSKSLG